MADQIVPGTEITSLLGVSSAEGERLADEATSLVQEAVDQRLVEVIDDQLTIMGTTDSWLALPERPVSSVSLVEINGEAVTDYKLVGSRLWRACGWSSPTTNTIKIYEPSAVDVTYTHGYPDGAQRLERAKTAVRGLAFELSDNPAGSSAGYSVDDYREDGRPGDDGGVKVPESVAKSLRRYYGRRAGLVRAG